MHTPVRATPFARMLRASDVDAIDALSTAREAPTDTLFRLATSHAATDGPDHVDLSTLATATRTRPDAWLYFLGRAFDVGCLSHRRSNVDGHDVITWIP